MSGEVVHLLGDPGGHIEALVRAAGLVVANAGVRTAIIGGLAVTCRLATTHRATGDVDVVADEPALVAEGRSAADNLVAAGIGERDRTTTMARVFVAGTKVEIIETAPIDPVDAAEVEPDSARLFVLSHRWALESASPCVVAVAGTDVRVEVPVATPAALVAMKLHAIQARAEDRKRASDAWDLLRLISAHATTTEFVDSFGEAPTGLAPLMRAAVERVLRAEVTRTRRWIQTYGDPAWIAQATEQAFLDAADDMDASLGDGR